MTKDLNDMTLAEHAEAWWQEQGREVPNRETQEWDEMYAEWIEFTFWPENQDRSDRSGPSNWPRTLP